jgi:hypothetical protein
MAHKCFGLSGIDGKVAWNDLKMKFSGGTEDQGLSGFPVAQSIRSSPGFYSISM